MAEPQGTNAPWKPGMLPGARPLWQRVLGTSLTVAVFAGACLLGARHHVPQVLAQGVAIPLLVFLLAFLGLTYVLSESAIGKPLRELAGRIPLLGPWLYVMDDEGSGTDGLLACPVCTGTWAAVAVAAIGFPVFGLSPGWWAARDLAIHGLLGAGVMYTLVQLGKFDE